MTAIVAPDQCGLPALCPSLPNQKTGSKAFEYLAVGTEEFKIPLSSTKTPGLSSAEHRRSFAILRALGATPHQLGAFLWSEALIVYVIYTIAGIAVGCNPVQHGHRHRHGLPPPSQADSNDQ